MFVQMDSMPDIQKYLRTEYHMQTLWKCSMFVK